MYSRVEADMSENSSGAVAQREESSIVEQALKAEARGVDIEEGEE